MNPFEERNARWERERKERDDNLRAAGYKLISCVAYRDPRTGDHPKCTWTGETETLVITNIPVEDLRYGIGCILVGPSSVVHVAPSDAYELARATDGIVLTVFKGKRPV
jgi:hypothetical protein